MISIKELIKNPEKIENINDLEILKSLIEEGETIIKPYEDALSKIRTQQKALTDAIKEEDKKKRIIKNFKILENLLSDLGANFKGVILDLDEMLPLVGNGGWRYFTSTNLDDILIENEIDESLHDTYNKKIFEFLTSNNILIQIHEYYCESCYNALFTFKGKPTFEMLKTEIESYCDDIDDFYCGECNSQLECNLKYTQPKMYYKLV